MFHSFHIPCSCLGRCNGTLYTFTNKIMYEWLSSLNTGLPGFINLVPLAKIICSLMRHHIGYENADFILMASRCGAGYIRHCCTYPHNLCLAAIVLWYCCSKHSKASLYQTKLTCTECEHNRCTISYLFRHFFNAIISVSFRLKLCPSNWTLMWCSHWLTESLTSARHTYTYVCYWVPHITNQFEGHNFNCYKGFLMMALKK